MYRGHDPGLTPRKTRLDVHLASINGDKAEGTSRSTIDALSVKRDGLRRWMIVVGSVQRSVGLSAFKLMLNLELC